MNDTRKSSRRRGRPARLARWPMLRMYVVLVITVLLFLGLGWHAFGLQVERNEDFREAAERQHLASFELPAPRGVIRDAAGRELAVTADAASIYANPREVEGVTETAETLSAILGQSVLSLEDKLSSDRHFVWIRRHVTDDVAQRVTGAGLKGIKVAAEPRRYYPGKTVAGPILGFSNIDGRGIEGIELAMNDLLQGQKAKRAALRDATGSLMLTADDSTTALPGATVVLTLDRYLQFIAERALQRAVVEHEAKAGTIVVLDVGTSEVLAMASWPTYDPNAPEGRGQARNRAVTDVFEMGSVMKLFTFAGALDRGVIDTSDTFDIEGGRLKIGRKVIRDSYRDQLLDVAGVFRRSSNVGTIKIARRLGAEGLYETLERFGFGRATGIELPGERSGLLHPTKRWGDIGLASVSYGYMTLVTPLQVAAAYAAVGNGGQYLEPRVVKEVRDPSGAVLYRHVPDPRQAIAPETAAMLLPIMSGVFDKGKQGGTARKIDIDGYRAGGKTGTSHKVDPATKKYSDDLYLSSFAGLAPIEAPRIAVVVMIDEPGGDHYYGAEVAGPAFAEVVAETLRYLGVEPSAALAAPADAAEPEPVGRGLPVADAQAVDSTVAEIEAAPPLVVPGDGRMPDFTGLSVAQALDRAREHRIAIVLEGSGVAIEQSPLPGSVAGDIEGRVVFAPETTHGGMESPPAER